LAVTKKLALATAVAIVSLASIARADETGYVPDGKFHGYIGANVAAVLPGVWETIGEGVEASIRAGLISDDIQIDFSVSPGSSILANSNCCTIGAPSIVFFRGDMSVAYLIKLSNLVYWPIRAGVGGGAMIAPNVPCFDCTTVSTITSGFVEARLDVVGALIRTSKHFNVQMEIPSVRVLAVPNGTSIIEWNTTLEMAYVF
jgi:hypothetical protein